MIREALLKRAERVMASRSPDFEVGPPGDRYMLRWHLCSWSNYEKGSVPKNRWEAFVRALPAVYVHRFLHDDDDRALHDHPFGSVSIPLKTGYWEVLFVPLSETRISQLREQAVFRPTYKTFRKEGSVTIRRAATAHRIVLKREADGSIPETVSLFLMGFRIRDWGFYCPKGWKFWKDFVSSRDRGAIGVGCGED